MKMASGHRVVATLGADMQVYPTTPILLNHAPKLANLFNYKIRTEQDLNAKVVGQGTVVDLGKQLLQYAKDNDVEGVKLMLQRGAPFTADWLGMSALHFAAMNNQLEICQLLLKAGINKDAKTKVDRTALHLACFYGNEAIVDLLLSKNCAINARDMLNMTPLHWAVEKKFKSIVRKLLAVNADVTVTSKFGRTPLGLAVLTEQADLLQELEAAKQKQAKQKQHQEQEKETNAAVNALKASEENNEDIDIDDVDDDIIETAFTTLPTNNLNDPNVLVKKAVDLLKSHGIAMMPENNDDSKELLNTALQNGRQLILSEGGKLLLNESLKSQNNVSSKNILRVQTKKSEPASGKTNALNQIRNNGITKSKSNETAMKHKNIRVITYNDFRKLYGNAYPPGKLSPSMMKSLANLKESLNESNVEGSPSKQPEAKLTNSLNVPASQESNSISNIATVDITDSEIAVPDNERLRPPHPQPAAAAPTTPFVKCNLISRFGVSPKGGTDTNAANIVYPRRSVHGKVEKVSTVNLLGIPEICRQLEELRKENAELKRRLEMTEKFNEEMRQRLDRLEDATLVDPAAGFDYAAS